MCLCGTIMKGLYKNIIINSEIDKTQLAVLIDPDKMKLKNVSTFIEKVKRSIATHILIGGSEVKENIVDAFITEIKSHTNLPVILFPGDINQIARNADGILFLSLISGRNPEYLIGKQIEAVPKLANTSLEIIPTGYILIENGKKTSVERVSETIPMSRSNIDLICDTAKAGEFLGMKLIYLEAGSGATHPIEPTIISKVKSTLNIPLIVGGGIRTKMDLDKAIIAGADLVVIGTAFEEDETFFEELLKPELKITAN